MVTNTRISMRRNGFTLAALLLLALLLSHLVYRLPMQAYLDLGSPASLDHIRGFYAPEANDEYTYAFSTDRATTRLPTMGAGCYALRLRLSGWEAGDGVEGVAARPSRLTLALQNSAHAPLAFDVRPYAARYHLLLPAGGGGRETLVWHSPTRTPGDSDTRALGIMFDQMTLRTLRPHPTVAQTMPLVLVALFAWGLAVRWGGNGNPRILAVLCALPLLVLVALLLLSDPWHTPHRLPLRVALVSGVLNLLVWTPWRAMVALLREHILVSPERSFALWSAVAGVMSLLITPPFQVADEHTHFHRAYHISEGHLLPVQDEVSGTSGGVLPRSVVFTSKRFAEALAFHPEHKQSIEAIRLALAEELAPDDRTFHPYYALMYPSIPYLHVSATIALGRAFGASPVLMMYMARFASLILSSLLVYQAIRMMPFLKWGLCLLALTPMAIFQRSSLSADVYTNTVSFLLVAFLLQCAFDQGKATLRCREVLALFLLTTLISFAKQPYMLLLLLYLLIPVQKVGSLARYIGLFVAVLLVSGACVLSWSIAAQDINILPVLPASVHPGQQITHVLNHPLQVAYIIIHNYFSYGFIYLHNFIGTMGWLDTPMPQLYVLCFVVLLEFVALIDGCSDCRVNGWHRTIITGVMLMIVGAIGLALYITWTPVGAAYLTGISGRYFIPVSPLFLLLFFNRSLSLNIPARRLHLLINGCLLLSFLAMTMVLVDRYYVPFLSALLTAS